MLGQRRRDAAARARLGSDALLHRLVNGLSIATDLPLAVTNLIVSATFLAFAMARGRSPGSAPVRVAVVGLTVSGRSRRSTSSDGWVARSVLLVAAMPVLAAGIAA